jgi:DNA gyrase subunit A
MAEEDKNDDHDLEDSEDISSDSGESQQNGNDGSDKAEVAKADASGTRIADDSSGDSEEDETDDNSSEQGEKKESSDADTEEDGKEPEEEEEKGILPCVIEDEMKGSYIDYAMSVIVGRALPDIRDGLKPVHRRILFAMKELGLFYNKPYRKCARIVGDVLGKYHPHGDSAVYESLVRMAQDFSLRYPLVQGQGNFGSIDGDSAAAMRYTEARLAKISQEMLEDIDKDTVDLVDNFDGSLKEPSVLPARIPNLLINGSSGIAVGMATNIPPHNLKEVSMGVMELIDNPDISIRELCETVKGPDFPTGGIICGKSGIMQAFATGNGKVTVRGKAEIEEKKNKKAIIITEIPYMINKSSLIEQIAGLVKDKVVPDISDLRDESDREGMRIVIELKKDANEEIVLNQLYKHSRLQNTFGINMVALVDDKPKVLNLKEMIESFVEHRKDVIIRRTKFTLDKMLDRAHILEGLIIALDDIDKVIALIKGSGSVSDARDGLQSNYKLTEKQAQAILDMRLQKLTSLEQEKLRQDLKETQETIKELREILSSESRVMQIIKDETNEILSKYSDERKTEIIDAEEDIDIEDLIEDEAVVVTISHSGYIKRMSLDNYKTQRRGGRGIIATRAKEDDFVEHIFIANTHDQILFFTSNGNVQWLKVYKIPDSTRYSAGKAIVNLLQLKPGTDINAFIPIKEFDDQHYLLMSTKNGVVKKTNLSAYSRPRAGGIIAINLDEDDWLINVKLTDGNQNIIIASKNGMAVKFHEKDARPVGRTSRGVRGIRLKGDDEVVGMILADDERTILTVTQNGYGKRTPISEYRLINRGGSGVRNIICSERNGPVATIMSIDGEEDIMLVSQHGIMIRMSAEGISTIGRNTQGVRLMRLSSPDDRVVSAAKIVNEDEPEDIESKAKEDMKEAKASFETGSSKPTAETEKEKRDEAEEDIDSREQHGREKAEEYDSEEQKEEDTKEPPDDDEAEETDSEASSYSAEKHEKEISGPGASDAEESPEEEQDEKEADELDSQKDGLDEEKPANIAEEPKRPQTIEEKEDKSAKDQKKPSFFDEKNGEDEDYI